MDEPFMVSPFFLCQNKKTIDNIYPYTYIYTYTYMGMERGANNATSD